MSFQNSRGPRGDNVTEVLKKLRDAAAVVMNNISWLDADACPKNRIHNWGDVYTDLSNMITELTSGQTADSGQPNVSQQPDDENPLRPIP